MNSSWRWVTEHGLAGRPASLDRTIHSEIPADPSSNPLQTRWDDVFRVLFNTLLTY